MDSQLAAAALRSSAPAERLAAARYFARNPEIGNIQELSAALRRETVSWVKKALGVAINKAAGLQAVADAANETRGTETVPYDLLAKQVYAKATEEVTAKILHEFQPVLAILRVDAANEVANFESSRVKVSLDRFDNIISGIESLKMAATSPKNVEFDLAKLIKDIVAAEGEGSDVDISLIGSDPAIVIGDPSLLRLAICNGLRNAIEAMQPVPKDRREHALVVNWGETDIDNWVAIIDCGRGFVGPAQNAFQIGATTKEGHTGMGLAIARQAMESIEGEISLTPGKDTGARFEVRWYR